MSLRHAVRMLLFPAAFLCACAPSSGRNGDDDSPPVYMSGDGGNGGAASQAGQGGNGGRSESVDAAARTDAPSTPTPDASPAKGDTGGSSNAPDARTPPPAGLVPMFVAAGHGGRTVTSCDDGQTWIANDIYENANIDHSPNTEKGFVYGNGIFMQLLGWGAPSSVKISRNGVDWKRVNVNGGGAGLVYLDKPKPTFITPTGYGGCMASSDGEAWTRCPAAPNYSENMREAGGGGPAVGGGGDIPAVFSFDAGKTWKGTSACALVDGFGNLGQEGGFAWGAGVFVGVSGQGDWCQTADLGVTWKSGKLGGSASGKMAFLGDRFWAPNGRDVVSSADGLTWTRETFKPAGVNIHAMARGDSGTYVGIERANVSNRFYRSTDGITWTSITGPSGTSLRRVVFGYGQPSAACPGS